MSKVALLYDTRHADFLGFRKFVYYSRLSPFHAEIVRTLNRLRRGNAAVEAERRLEEVP